MSVFSNEDLKRLKEWMNRPSPFAYEILPDRLQALLARLEAAERVAEEHSGHDDDCDEITSVEGGCSCGYDVDEKAWRKAAGK